VNKATGCGHITNITTVQRFVYRVCKMENTYWIQCKYCVTPPFFLRKLETTSTTRTGFGEL